MQLDILYLHRLDGNRHTAIFDPETSDGWTRRSSRCFVRGATRSLADIRIEDGVDEVLTIGRQPIAAKRLFFFHHLDFTVASTDISVLLKGISVSPDPLSWIRYFSNGCPRRSRSFCRAIRSVPAGYKLVISPNRIPTLSPMGEAAAPRISSEFAERQADCETLVDVAIRDVRKRIVPDRTALLLSGGVDSGYLAHAFQHSGIAAFTVHFEHARMNEDAFARETAGLYGIDIQTVRIGLKEIEAGFDWIASQPEPCAAWSTVFHRAVVEAIAGSGRDALIAGLGADEVFGGYPNYIAAYKAMREHLEGASHPISPLDELSTFLLDRTAPARGVFSGVGRFVREDAIDEFLAEPFRGYDLSLDERGYFHELGLRQPYLTMFPSLIRHELDNRIPDLLFASFHPVSDAYGVEAHYPFLHPKLCKWAVQLPATDRFHWNGAKFINKYLWRTVAEKRLPRATTERPQRTYDAPINSWLRLGPVRDRILDRLASQSSRSDTLLDPEKVERLSNLVLAASADKAVFQKGDAEAIWTVFTYLEWLDRWVTNQ